MRLLVLLSLPLLVLAACNGGGDEGGAATGTPGGESPSATPLASPWPGGVQRPEGFPADFPIYDNATVTDAGRLTASQGDMYVISMETADAADAVRSFYEARLAEAPWEVTNVLEIPDQSTVIVEFARESGEAGTLAISEEQTNGHRTIVTISMPASAPAATPTATASAGP
jgi:hypothetical protein